MPKTAETIFNIFIFIPLGIALAIAVRHLIRGQGPVLLYCIVGGGLAALFEPVVDVLGLVYLKEEGALGTFTMLDRTMPLYICFVYPWFVGGLGYVAYRIFERGVTMRALFGALGGRGRRRHRARDARHPAGHLPVLRQSAAGHLGLPTVVGLRQPGDADRRGRADLQAAAASGRRGSCSR